MLSVAPERPVDPFAIEILKQVDRVAQELGLEYFVAGATARDILLSGVFGLDTGRGTRDVDLAIAIDGWPQFEASLLPRPAPALKRAVLALPSRIRDKNAHLDRMEDLRSQVEQPHIGRPIPLRPVPMQLRLLGLGQDVEPEADVFLVGQADSHTLTGAELGSRSAGSVRARNDPVGPAAPTNPGSDPPDAGHAPSWPAVF
jgi:hypothetical protein